MEKKKKIGVISIWDIDNYGNRLQNYAMNAAVKSLGYDSVNLKMWPQKKWKRIFQYVTNFDVSNARIAMEKKKGNQREVNFLTFEKNIKKDRRFLHSVENRGYINKTYDGFVVGSDQIWNPVFLEESYYFAAFADSNKNTVSYAASMGVSELNENDKKKLKNGLTTLKNVSVREDAAADIIEAMGEKRPKVVIDPTMLIDAKEWETLEKKPEYIKGDFVVLYYLGDLLKECKEMIEKVCRENNLQMVILGKPEYADYYTAGPAEFLYLIHHAKSMYTDSFHGCVFSILFHTPFYVFERENSVQKMNSRIDTLLKTFALEDRVYVGNGQEIKLDCDFTQADVNLKKKKEEGYAFLKESLS